MRTTSLAALDPAIGRQLSSLRAALRLRLLARGGAWILLTVGLLAVLTVVIDYGQYRMTLEHVGYAQRAGVAVICLGIVAWVVWTRLVRPMLGAMDDEALALVAEQRHRDLGDRLISAVQFGRDESRDHDQHGESDALRDRVKEQARDAIGSLRLADIATLKRSRQLFVGVAALWVTCAVAAALRAEVAKVWFQRAVLLADIEYPRRTHLNLEGPDVLRVVRGGSLEVRVTADRDNGHSVPDAVTFHMSFPSVGDVSEQVTAKRDAANVFVKRFEVVAEPFSFSVSADDDRTRTVRVDVAEPPQLRDVAFTVTAPGYTGIGQTPTEAPQGAINVPVGSDITVRATSTKTLSRVRVFLDDKPLDGFVIEQVAASPRGLRGSFTLSAPKPFRPQSVLRFELTDSEGFTTPRGAAYTLNLQVDRPPEIQLAVVGVSSQITGQAMIPLEITTTDDYGVASLYLEQRIASLGGEPRRALLRSLRPPQRSIEGWRYMVDLKAISSEGGPTFEVGETLTLQAIAQDALPEPDGPHETASNPITLRIVDAGDILANLLESQRAMREQLRKAQLAETEIRDRLVDASQQLTKASDTQRATTLIRENINAQQQVNDLVKTTLERLNQVLERLRYNRVGAQADHERLRQRIIGPLAALNDKALPHLLEGMSQTLPMRDAKSTAADVDELAAEALVVLQQMDAILREMVKVENAQQIDRGLVNIIRMGSEVRGLIKRGVSGADDDNSADKKDDEGGTP